MYLHIYVLLYFCKVESEAELQVARLILVIYFY